MKTSVKYFRRDELINGLVNAPKINKKQRYLWAKYFNTSLESVIHCDDVDENNF